MPQRLNSIRVAYEPLRSLGFAAISATYAAVGTKFLFPVRMLKVVNGTDANLIIGYAPPATPSAGITAVDFVSTGSAFIYDFESNKSDPSGELVQPAGMVLYIRLESAAATSGNVYVTCIYAS